MNIDVLADEKTQRLRALAAEGRTVIGYFCTFVPVEILTAFGVVPYFIQGSVHEPISLADEHLETAMCPYVRSCLDLALKGTMDFLSGVVVPHSCDTIQRIYDIWKFCENPKYDHFINVPHMLGPSSEQFFRRDIELFAESLERFTGTSLTADRLREAIAAHNQTRKLVREVYTLRRSNPPALSGLDVMEVMLRGTGMPVTEFDALLQGLIERRRQRQLAREGQRPRVLIYGSKLDDTAFVRLVEECGADVVMDDTCNGSRPYWAPVDESIDPLDALARHYLNDIHCPRTYIPQGKDRQDDLEKRLGYLGRHVQEFGVDGVILYVMRYCDTYELDAPDVIEYLNGKGIRTLHLENDYSAMSLGQVKTRVEAFLEMM